VYSKSESSSIGKVARQIILYVLSAAVGWFTTSITDLSLWTSALNPAIHIVSIETPPGECAYQDVE